ncbi:MAG: aminotransferase class V-fold PLP-dependent enzyme, partial [Anaerolineae bacterium]
DAGAAVVVDGAQAVPHLVVDAPGLGVDFYAFSGHKMFGPTGIGALYARRPWLDRLPPYQGGGEMIRSVTFEATEYAAPPSKFEAGTPNIAGAVGLGAAVDYLANLDRAGAAAHEARLLTLATTGLLDRPGVAMVGTAGAKIGVASFTVAGIHPHDLATILDGEGVAIRAGHHCAQPVMEHFGIPATARASIAFYNTAADVQGLMAAMDIALEMFEVR